MGVVGSDCAARRLLLSTIPRSPPCNWDSARGSRLDIVHDPKTHRTIATVRMLGPSRKAGLAIGRSSPSSRQSVTDSVAELNPSNNCRGLESQLVADGTDTAQQSNRKWRAPEASTIEGKPEMAKSRLSGSSM